MEMGRGNLIFLDEHYLLAIDLVVALHIAVTDGYKGKTLLGKVTLAEVSYVPTETVVSDFIAFRSSILCRCSLCPP